MNKKLFLFYFIAIFTASIVNAESVFKNYQLDKSLSISIPRNWTIYGTSEKDYLNQHIEAIADEIDEIDYADLKDDINLLKAVSRSPGYATISIDSTKLYDIKNFSNKDLESFDKELKGLLKKMLPLQGFNLRSYSNSYKQKISNHPTLTSTYIRSGIKGDVKVFMHQIQTKKRIIKISYSYRIMEEKFWTPVFNKINNSIRIVN